MEFEELTAANRSEARALILQGLGSRWGSIDETLNPDLDDMVASYSHGRTILLRSDDGLLLGTGTVVPRSERIAEVVRMSVAASAQRSGHGRRILAELIDTASQWGMSKVILETSSSWTSAVDFYQRCGFTITHTDDSEFDEATWFELRLG